MEKRVSRNLVFIVTIIIAITSALPHLYGYFTYHSQYTPFNLYEGNQYQRDELYAYTAQVQQILKGNLVGDSYIWEGRNKPSPFLSEFASVTPIAILSFFLNTKLGLVVSDFIFPSILFLIIFSSLKKHYHYLLSLISASAVIFTPFFSMLIPYFSKGGFLWTGTTIDPLFITRSPHPQISQIYLFSAVFMVTTALFSKKATKLIPVAIIAAVSLYSSIFVSSTIILGILFLTPTLLKRSTKNEILLALLIFLIISLPWLFNFISNYQFLKESDFFTRASYSKELLFPRQLRYIGFAILFFLLSKKPISKTILAFAFSAGIFMDFHQLILGRSLDVDHWITRVLAPLITLALFLTMTTAIKKYKYFKIILSGILVCVILIGIFFQVKWIKQSIDMLKPDSSKVEIFEKIKKVSKKDDVIASSSLELNQFIPGSTGRYIYIGPLERALLGSSEQLKRICDVYQIFKEKNLASYPDQLLDLEISFQKWKLNKDINKDLFVKQCLEKKTSYYKIDYLVDKKPDGGYELIKYDQ